MNSDQFDKLIKRMLEGLKDPYDESTWNSLEEKIEATDATLLEDGLFDGIISDKLNKIEPAFESSHWDLMEQAIENDLNQPELEDVYLDGITYENLSNLKSPYNPEHWEIMSEKLDNEFSIRRKLVRYKVAEVALLLLLLFTVGQFIPIQKSSVDKGNDFAINETETIANPATTSDEQQNTTNKQTNEANIIDLSQSESVTETPASSNSIQITSANNSNVIGLQQNAVGSEIDHPVTLDAVAYVSKIEDEAKLEAKIAIEKQSNNFDKGQALNAEVEEPSESNKAEQDPASSLNLAVPFNKLPSLQAQLIDQKDPGLPALTLKSEAGNTGQIRIGIFGAADLNYVHTGYDAKFAKAPYGRYASGYSGGISISKRIGKFEIETGGIYAATYYHPDTVNVIYSTGSLAQGGYIGEGFYATHIDMIRIPLNARYDFAEWNEGKWRAYALAGIGINLAIQKSYFSRQYIISDRNNLRDVQAELLAEGESNKNDSMYPGLFEPNGKLQGNHFFTANAGLGLERLLNQRWSLFAQPVYQHQFTSATLAGPNRDKFKNLSLLLGTKVTFR